MLELKSLAVVAIALAALVLGFGTSARADGILLGTDVDSTTTNTLHEVCIGTTVCTSTNFPGGTSQLVSNTSLPNWAIRRSPASNSGYPASVGSLSRADGAWVLLLRF
jgi:hypothetical protein